MTLFQIISEFGVDMGTYEAETIEDAVRQMNIEAGESNMDRNDGLVVVDMDDDLVCMGRCW